MAEGKIEHKLRELGIELPPIFNVPPGMNFLRYVQTGDLLFIAGHGPTGSDGRLAYQGKVGGEVSLEEGYKAARLTGLNLLSTLKEALGDLDRVVKFVKVLGMVNAVEGFGQQPYVINGASDLFVAVFGEEIGKHARSAVGMGGLPNNMPIEIEMIVQVR
ncbi:MAG: RidA family protein [Chloroflexi bacterium]|uniref:RidA family protein n=1 Tax=Candidatus Chlorohelix allophototropha TaxID=3003348 RepID=A0A8T7LXE6_9CHLR|nr:RidA family protein [Chloroflexota bacterium]WJW67420.1 RidA family protein [Chloroflexota bacterium L227-S17]